MVLIDCGPQEQGRQNDILKYSPKFLHLYYYYLPPVILTGSFWQYPHFMDKETEAWKE